MAISEEQNFFLGVRFLCPLCGLAIQFIGEHLRHFHRITETGVAQKLLKLEEFSVLTILPKNFDNELVQSRKGQRRKRKRQEQSCDRFRCRHCVFVHEREDVLMRHVADGHLCIVSDVTSHWKRQRMSLILQRIDQVWRRFYDNNKSKHLDQFTRI